MSRKILNQLSIYPLVTAFSLLALAVPAGAQSLTPGGNNAGLQSQTGQTQTTTNSLNQTGGLQNNNSQPALNNSGTRPLGVVSDPRQTTPDAVAQPSGTLKTDITPTGSSTAAWLIPVTVVVLAAIAAFAWARAKRSPQNSAAAQAEPAPIIRPEPVKPRKKRSGTPKKKRKKSHQR